MHTMLVWKNFTDIYELIYIINLMHLPSWTCRLEWNSVLGRIEYENSVRIDCLVNTRQDEQWLVRWPIALRNSISRPMCLSFLPEFPLALPTYTEVDVGDINFTEEDLNEIFRRSITLVTFPCSLCTRRSGPIIISNHFPKK